MNTPLVTSVVATATASAVLTVVFAAIAPRLGLADDGSDAPARKTQRRAVPLVGGAVLFTLFLSWTALAFVRVLPEVARPSVLAIAAVTLAFALGLADDRAPRGLTPRAKFRGQLGVAAFCALHACVVAQHGAATCAWAGEHAPLADAVLTFGLALAALNAFNTFDNADGAATTLGVLGFAAAAPLTAAACAGFLPFNLFLRRADGHGGSTPRAYLGDSGAHVAGVFVALQPELWPVLVLPLLDLARLARLRWARGSRPWIGDRRHLAHRLQARGLGPSAVVLCLAAIAAPALAAATFGGERAWVLPAGVAATCALFVFAVRATPDVE